MLSLQSLRFYLFLLKIRFNGFSIGVIESERGKYLSEREMFNSVSDFLRDQA